MSEIRRGDVRISYDSQAHNKTPMKFSDEVVGFKYYKMLTWSIVSCFEHHTVSQKFKHLKN